MLRNRFYIINSDNKIFKCFNTDGSPKYISKNKDNIEKALLFYSSEHAQLYIDVNLNNFGRHYILMV